MSRTALAEPQVRLTEKRSSFLQFVTSACAIIGGVFTISGIVDAFVYHGQQVRLPVCVPMHACLPKRIQAGNADFSCLVADHTEETRVGEVPVTTRCFSAALGAVFK